MKTFGANCAWSEQRVCVPANVCLALYGWVNRFAPIGLYTDVGRTSDLRLRNSPNSVSFFVIWAQTFRKKWSLDFGPIKAILYHMIANLLKFQKPRALWLNELWIAHQLRTKTSVSAKYPRFSFFPIDIMTRPHIFGEIMITGFFI